jgi:LCP family protein required for cell wall assembly
VFAFVIVAGSIGVYAYAKHIERTMQRTVFQKEKLDIKLEPAKPQKPYNVLILGFDKRPKEKTFRSDTMILARIDPKTKEVWLISIPRDLRANIPGHGYSKINDAYYYGKEQLAIDTVEKLTDQKINYYMGVNFTGFRKIVDAMGGVWIKVPVEINDTEADPSKGNKYSHIDAGYQRLDGNHAITFVRARHQFADQDFSRMKNQQRFFKAIADQIATKTSVAKILRIIATAAPYISTNMSLSEMLRTAQAMKGAGSKNVYATTLPGSWRTPYIWLDEEAADKILAKFEAGKPFKAKKPATSTESSKAAEPAPAEKSDPKPSEITVTVRNGAGIAGCAKQAASILKAQAFKVKAVGNANQFVYPKTLVVYKKDKSAAEQILKALPPGTKLVESRGMYAFNTDVLVVVGKDWDLAKVPVTPVQTN